MEVIRSELFDKDVERLDNSLRRRLQKAIRKVEEKPFLGKPMKHAANVFSERVGNHRLVYYVEEEKIVLVGFRNRKTAYEYVH